MAQNPVTTFLNAANLSNMIQARRVNTALAIDNQIFSQNLRTKQFRLQEEAHVQNKRLRNMRINEAALDMELKNKKIQAREELGKSIAGLIENNNENPQDYMDLMLKAQQTGNQDLNGFIQNTAGFNGVPLTLPGPDDFLNKDPSLMSNEELLSGIGKLNAAGAGNTSRANALKRQVQINAGGVPNGTSQTPQQDNQIQEDKEVFIKEFRKGSEGARRIAFVNRNIPDFFTNTKAYEVIEGRLFKNKKDTGIKLGEDSYLYEGLIDLAKKKEAPSLKPNPGPDPEDEFKKKLLEALQKNRQ